MCVWGGAHYEHHFSFPPNGGEKATESNLTGNLGSSREMPDPDQFLIEGISRHWLGGDSVSLNELTRSPLVTSVRALPSLCAPSWPRRSGILPGKCGSGDMNIIDLFEGLFTLRGSPANPLCVELRENPIPYRRGGYRGQEYTPIVTSTTLCVGGK